MNNFLLGVVSSSVAALLIYVFRYYIGFILNFVFYKAYPNISGDYLMYSYEQTNEGEIEPSYSDEFDDYYDEDEIEPLYSGATNEGLLEYLKEYSDSSAYVKMKIKQFAFKIKGEIITVKNGIIIEKEEFVGKILPSRIATVSTETTSEEHHNFGTYLLTLTNNNKIIKGIRTFLCVSCGDAASDNIILEKI
nr:hypothetical protein [uncultured Draconibacterium sp.]